MKRIFSVMVMVMMLMTGMVSTVDAQTISLAKPPTVITLNTVVKKELPVFKYLDKITEYIGKPQAEVLKFIETKTEAAYLEKELDGKTFRVLDANYEFIGWVYFDGGIMTACYIFEEYSDLNVSNIVGNTQVRTLQQKWSNSRFTLASYIGATTSVNQWDYGMAEYITYPGSNGNIYSLGFVTAYDPATDTEFAMLELTTYLNKAAFDIVPKG